MVFFYACFPDEHLGRRLFSVHQQTNNVLNNKTNRKRFGQEVDDTDEDRLLQEEARLQEAYDIQAFIDAGNTKTAAAAKFGLSRPTIDSRLKQLGEMGK